MHDWLRDKLQPYEDDGCVFWSGPELIDRNNTHNIKYSEANKIHNFTPNEYILVMKKTPNTITNEDIYGIIDHLHASYTANRLEVVAIINKFVDNEENITYLNGYRGTYRVGDIVKEHFYALTYETIYCMTDYECRKNYGNVQNGSLKAWFVNGIQMTEYDVVTKVEKLHPIISKYSE